MKTNMLKLLSVVILLIILVIGCKKNQTSTTEEKSNPINIQKIESVVKYCTDRVQNSLKTTDSIPIDSTSYYLEAASNYTHGIASAHGDSQKIDSTVFTINCNNKKVALTDIRSIYSAIIDSIRVSYMKIVSSNKNLIAVEVSSVSEQSDQINVKAVSVIIYGNSQLGRFDTTDYWLWWNMGGNYGGKCGPYSGQTNLDAAIEIQQHVMLRKGLSNGYYAPPIVFSNIFPEDFTNPNHSGSDCYFKYYLYENVSTSSCCHLCLAPFEMNWYLNGAEHICYDSENGLNPGARPDGLSFISLDLTGDMIYPMNYTVYLIHGTVKYGVFIQGGNQLPL